MRLYDVCNDYSLCGDVSDRSIEESNSDKYEWLETSYFGNRSKIGKHIEYGEIHYFMVDSDVDYTGYFLGVVR